MASLYTRKANRKRLAMEAMHKLQQNRTKKINFYSLTCPKVRGAELKSK